MDAWMDGWSEGKIKVLIKKCCICLNKFPSFVHN